MSRRGRNWRYLLLFVAAALLPWKLAAACSQLDCMTDTECCCADTVAPCPQSVCGSAAGCCLAMAGPSPTTEKSHALLQRSNGDPPALPRVSIPAAISPSATGGPFDRRQIRLVSSSDIYLRTNRLRL